MRSVKRCVCGVADKAHKRKSRRNQLPIPKPVSINHTRWLKAKEHIESGRDK